MSICSFISPFVLCFSCFFRFLISTSRHNTTNFLSLTQQQQQQQQPLLLPILPSLLPTTLLLPLYIYIHCFSELRRIILDYASRDKIYHFIHLALRNTTVRTRTPLEYYTTISNISENNKLLCNY